MSYQKPVIKSKIHTANKTVSNEDRAALEGKVADVKRNEVELKQEEIDNYNFNTCSQIDPAFENLQLTGKHVIVRLHKENYIKSIEVLPGGIPIYDAWISQVDGRMRQTDPPKWVDNPLPYVFMGTVVAISPLAKAEFLKEKEELEKYDPAAAKEYKVLSVGDTVTLNHFMFADNRFYLNKQQRDFIKNPNEYRIEHWEGYVKIHPTVIESIVVAEDSNKFLASPFMEYKKWTIVNDTTTDNN